MKAIVHVDKNWGIGRNNSLMFRLPADMKFFREVTVGNTVVMGANTLRSLPGAKPLKDRLNIVLSSSLPYSDDYMVVRNMEALSSAIECAKGEVYVIGGAAIYRMLLPYCAEVLVTKVAADGNADVFFPDLDKDESFYLCCEGNEIETNGLKIKFCTYSNRYVKPLK